VIIITDTIELYLTSSTERTGVISVSTMQSSIPSRIKSLNYLNNILRKSKDCRPVARGLMFNHKAKPQNALV
jgi:hypothetical protein